MPRSAVEAGRLLINLSPASSKTLQLRSIAATALISRSSFSSSTSAFYPSVATSAGQGRRHPYYDAIPSARLSIDPKAPGTRPAGPPPPPNETPAQKVARLRAQRERELMKNIPLWDRVVVQGRIWADRVHTITLFGLLLSALVLFVGGTIVITDMIFYNRREKRLYKAAYRNTYEQRLDEAITLQERGEELTEFQRLIIEEELERIESQQARKWKRGIRKYFKAFLWGSLHEPPKPKDVQAPDLEEEERKEVIDMVKEKGALEAAWREGIGDARILKAVAEKRGLSGGKPAEEVPEAKGGWGWGGWFGKG
ncbi:MAG: hypothetical protein LQ351_008021 [Letrouitia transgressa]|nr:MAG: hypothetical protein LQ351_008021 [Letrouitia transgressa]